MKYFIPLICLITFASCETKYDCSGYSEETPTYSEKAIELNQKATDLQLTFNDDSALYYYDLAIAEDESYDAPHIGRGRIFIHKKEYDLALAEFEQVVALRPNFAEGHSALAMLYDFLDQDEKAMTTYEKAIQLHTDRIECSGKDEEILRSSRIDRAIIYLLSGNEDEGVSELEEIKASFKGDAEMQKAMDDLIHLDKEEFLKEIHAN